MLRHEFRILHIRWKGRTVSRQAMGQPVCFIESELANGHRGALAPLGFDANDANLYRYVFNRPTHFTDPLGLQKAANEWTVKLKSVDLKLLKDLKVSYALELDLTVPQVKNKYFTILSVDEKSGFGKDGKEGAPEPDYRLDVEGPATVPVDKVSYVQTGQAGDWAFFMRRNTKTFGFLPVAKGLKYSGKSNLKLDQNTYLGILVDLEKPIYKFNYTYIFVNTKLFREACKKAPSSASLRTTSTFHWVSSSRKIRSTRF